MQRSRCYSDLMGLEGRRALERARGNLHRDHVANASKGKIFPQVRKEAESHSVRN
ncbi:hypothetical protein AOX55_00006186 (plasmid) [Sinorhizobium fredii CCBAU 25509]|nr:hypothetical protein SF83666_b61760 [Sinorhizobium fredii CCBAU 83666]AWM28961.1 hypothetical protein AOX55_00006186 [Sinorhizobium fredii CCBAU 25509]